MTNEEVINLLDKIVTYLKMNEQNREQDVAIQKLEEAVFWLTYGIEED